MDCYEDVPIGKNPPEEVNVIVENSVNGDPVKYEMDKKSGRMIVDRFLSVAMRYPGNYGFIPNTLSEDGDPVDVLIIGQTQIMPGAVVAVKPIGVLLMEDEKGMDEKILAVPVDRLNPHFNNIKTCMDLPEDVRDQIEHFFKRYKDLDKGKWSKIHGWGDAEKAKELIKEGIARAKKAAEPEKKLAPGCDHLGCCNP